MFTYKQYLIFRCILIVILMLMAIVLIAGSAQAKKLSYVAVVDVHEGSGLRCRRGPGTEYAGYGMFAAGARLLVLEEHEGWARVAWPKIPEHELGWVCMDYLQK